MDKSQLSRDILSSIIAYMKYAKFVPQLKRREMWEETVERNKYMHEKKYPMLAEEISKAYEYVLEKKVLPSMRSMQFAGKAIEINNSRIYNCSAVAIDDPAAFNEIMFLLLSGTGAGYSVQKHHVKKLPSIRTPIYPKNAQERKKRYLVEDSIMGWANAVKVLMESYFEGTKAIDFDFRDIRPKGSLLKTAGGKAPGPQPLKDALHNITKVMDRALEERGENTKLKPIEVHDIVCFIAEAVLAGGIRRSACISLFSLDDDEMLAAKSGAWWEQNPQRSRANNSVMLIRHKVKKEDFTRIWEYAKASGAGEPGVVFSNDKEVLTNPCMSSNALIDCKRLGVCKLSDIEVGDEVWSISGWTKVLKKWVTGVKNVYRYENDEGNLFIGTDNHRVLYNGQKVKINDVWMKRHSPDSHYAIEHIPSYEATDVRPCFTPMTKEYIGEEEVWDITVDNETHTFWCGGFEVSNCAEISLKSCSFCNLTEVNVSGITSQEELNERVRIGAFLGTLQAGYTDLHYLRDIWRENTEKEALLGVSMTGIAGCDLYNLDFEEAAKIAVEENKRIAKIIGINPAYRVTTVKPSGTTSLICGSSSGVHAWHSKYYIRRVRVGKEEAIYKYLAKHNPELVEDEFFNPNDQAVISIPVKAPEGAITRTESEIDLLNRVKYLHDHWIKPGHRKGSNTHNVSCTVSVKPENWDVVADWMWENRDSYNGISVLPHSESTYKQMPFEECSEEEYEILLQRLKEVDLSKIVEMEDNTDLKGEAACAGGACTITKL